MELNVIKQQYLWTIKGRERIHKLRKILEAASKIHSGINTLWAERSGGTDKKDTQDGWRIPKSTLTPVNYNIE